MRGRGQSPATPKRKAEGTIRRIAVSSACGLNSHVRISTLLSIPQALSLHFIEISPSGPSGVIWRTTLSAPFFGSLRTPEYAPTSQSALNCKKAAQKSGFPFACARLLLFPTKRARCAPHRKFFRRGPHTAPLCGDPDGGALSLHFIRILPSANLRCVGRAALSELPRLRTKCSSRSSTLRMGCTSRG